MSLSAALHWAASKLDRSPSVTANLPPKRILADNVDPNTAARIADSINQPSITKLPYVAIKENTMSTTAVVPVTPTQPRSFLQKLGTAFKDVFTFLGSKQGQTIIATGEVLTEVALPGSAGVINLANAWLTEIIKTETLAAAAGEQNGTGTQKAGMVLSSVTPDVLAFAKANGLAEPTADKLATANAALVAFLNAFTVPAS